MAKRPLLNIQFSNRADSDINKISPNFEIMDVDGILSHVANDSRRPEFGDMTVLWLIVLGLN
jgi:hypothetical protein